MCGINPCVTADVYNSTPWDITHNDLKGKQESRVLHEFPFSFSSSPDNSKD